MFTILVILCILSYIIHAINIYMNPNELKKPLVIIQLILNTIIFTYGVLTP